MTESRGGRPGWAVRPNEPSGFRGRKAILNHASALVSLSLTLICQPTSEDIKHHFSHHRHYQLGHN